MAGHAENQANVKFSYKKYYAFRNKINVKFSERFRSDMKLDYAIRALCYGDTQPAVVVSVDPLLIATYSDEMDAVIILKFLKEFADLYNLSVGSRLTTSTVYSYGNKVADDIHIGENYSCQFADFIPIVQLFLGKDDRKITEKINLFGEDIWQLVSQKANDYMRLYPDCFRDGFFYLKEY